MKNVLALLLALSKGYTERCLALHAQGTLGFVGLAKEATWGTAVAATDYLEFMSENLALGIDRFPTRNAFGGFYEPRDSAGVRRNMGDLVVFGHPVSIGHLLRAALNTLSQSTVLSGFLYKTNFITVKSEWIDGGSNRVPAQSYTLEVHRDVTSSQRYAGAVCTRLSMNVAPNQDLRLTAGWIAKSFTHLARSAPTFPGSPAEPFTFDTCSVAIDGAASTVFESFGMVIDNKLTGLPALNASNEIARIRRDGEQSVRISGVLAFEDIAQLEDFRNQTIRRLALNLTRADSFNIFIDVPSFQYTTFPTGIAGRGRQTIGFDGMAQYNTGSALSIDIGLTTTKSNY